VTKFETNRIQCYLLIEARAGANNDLEVCWDGYDGLNGIPIHIPQQERPTDSSITPERAVVNVM